MGDECTMISGRVVIPIVAVVVAVAAAAALIILTTRDDTRTAAGPSSASHRPGQLTSAEASRLADDMTSGDEKRVRAAVAVAPEQPLDAAAVSGLAAIEAMTFDVRTLRDLGDGIAEVTARVVMPGGTQPAVWTVRLVTVEQEWLNSSTEPVQ
ncbi:hypothetical protein [Actinokineospora iranica]|nr:hypothetical protein [Actinokineospora iranica]